MTDATTVIPPPLIPHYDLIVIGGGSGGLSAAKEAASLGARVACFDYVVPSPQGTSWGLGGTCVNVGCIPKKLMHKASLHGEEMETSKRFGWVMSAPKHNWSILRDQVQAYINSLNFGYKGQLKDKRVDYYNGLVRFTGPSSVEASAGPDKDKVIGTALDIATDKMKFSSLPSPAPFTADRFIIAVGGRPRQLGIPGDEFVLTSDDIFSLKTDPGKTCVIGASYVALECAGFLRGLGNDVTILVRSIFLRGFDQECAEKIGSFMEHQGVMFERPCTPMSVQKLEDGQLKVTWKNNDTGEEKSDVFTTVLQAIGRDPSTSSLGLDTIGVQLSRTGKVLGDHDGDEELSSVSNVWAIGDVLEGKPELTPVAIKAGRLLARRMFAGSTAKTNYDFIPTTVFTPLEYGCIGFSEADANLLFGEENIEVYISIMKPLEWSLAPLEWNEKTDAHEQTISSLCYAKLIVNKTDNDRVIGFHYLGPNAGEVTQGFGVAFRCGATKADFDFTVGIHPTVAEEFTTMSVTKASGESAMKSGC